MKLAKLIQRILSLYSKGVQTDDSRLTRRHIYDKLTTVRNLLVFQKHNKKQTISPWNFTVLPCVELIEAPIHECPCLPSPGCLILKSKYPIPQPISGMETDLISSVTSLDGSIQYSPTTWEAKKYSKGKKFTSNSPDYFVRNNHIYITWSKGPKIVSISLLPKDPLEAENFKSYCEEDCNSFEIKKASNIEIKQITSKFLVFQKEGDNACVLYKDNITNSFTNVVKYLIFYGYIDEDDFQSTLDSILMTISNSSFIIEELQDRYIVDCNPEDILNNISTYILTLTKEVKNNLCKNCDPLENIFPIDGELEEPLVQLSVEELVGQFGRIQEDKVNDTSDMGMANIPYGGRRPKDERIDEQY